MEKSFSKSNSGTGLVNDEIQLESRRDQTTVRNAERREDIVPLDVSTGEVKQQFGEPVLTEKSIWTEGNVFEKLEKKLQEGVKKLATQSRPSRDRLAVFSDVFDDVCESSPVFGRILREIKTEYDLYVDHLMASHSSLPNRPENALHEDFGKLKVSKMECDEDEKEVRSPEQAARRSLEEEERVENDSQNIAAVAGPEDMDMKTPLMSDVQDGATGCTDSVQIRRLQVDAGWEEKIEKKKVPTVTNTAAGRQVKDLKTEIMQLNASIERLGTINKDLEDKINAVLNRQKASQTMRRLLWDKVYGQSSSDKR